MTTHLSINQMNALGGGLAGAVSVGLIGRGIGLSRTPQMHEDEGAALGLAYRYYLLDVDEMAAGTNFAEILDSAERAGFAGVNVTYPYKRQALDHLDRLSKAAEAIGAVNTIVFRDGARHGHNTDNWGFAESFRRTLAGRPHDAVLLVGAGGAGAAVANALLDQGVAMLLVADRDDAAAAGLCEKLNRRGGSVRARPVADLIRAAARVDGIVNATPVGMAKLPGSPVPRELLSARIWVADIVYFPLETELLGAARRAGCVTMNGAMMAVFQAVRAFELFTGRKPDHHRMMASFDAFTT